MSATLSSGLVGVSTQITLVTPGRTARGDGVDVGQRGWCVGEPPRLGHAGEEPVGAAVGVVGDDGVVAGPADRAQQGVLRREPRCEGETPGAPPSSAARHSCSASRVGLALREYS